MPLDASNFDIANDDVGHYLDLLAEEMLSCNSARDD